MSRSKRLSLERYDLEVTDEGYQRILAIARETAVCSDCEQPYSEVRPNVAGLLCLSCFLKGRSHLTFQGPLDPAIQKAAYGEDWSHSEYGPWPRIAFLFLDQAGNAHITTSFPDSSSSSSDWPKITVCYWKFPLPQEAQWNGGTIATRRFSLSIFGNPREDETLLLRFYDYHGNKTQEILFLARRNGAAIQINKRKGLHRQIFEQARAELEATREDSYAIQEEMIYRLVVTKIEEQRKAAEQRALIETTEEEEEEEA